MEAEASAECHLGDRMSDPPPTASRGEMSRPSLNIQSVDCVFTTYRQRSRSRAEGNLRSYLFTATQEIALAEPLLTFICPKTKERAPTRVEADVRTLRASWKSRLRVKCPCCGGVHEISVRDAYLNAAIDDCN
jgi:hypothetical protein